MIKRFILSLGLMLVFCCFWGNNNLMAANKQPIKLKYGLFIKKLVPNYKEGTFYAEFYWWLKFKNDSTKSDWKNADIVNLEFTNSCRSENGSFQKGIHEARLLKDHSNYIYYSGYHQGDFYFSPDFTFYPFDEQVLSITIENVLIPKEKLVIELDSASYLKSHQNSRLFGLSNDIVKNQSINFRIKESIITTDSGIYNTDFGDPEFNSHSAYSRLNVAILIDRSFIPFITKLVIPLAIILFLVYFVFYIPPEKIDIAAGLTVTSLLSAIAFQLSINGDIPEIGYIIYIDKVFYSCYFLIAVSMAESLWTYSLDKTQVPSKVKLASRIDVAARFLFPICFLLSLYIFSH